MKKIHGVDACSARDEANYAATAKARGTTPELEHAVEHILMIVNQLGITYDSPLRLRHLVHAAWWATNPRYVPPKDIELATASLSVEKLTLEAQS